MTKINLNKGRQITLEDIYNTAKINWTNFYVSFDDCQNDSPIRFDIMPNNYLEFAQNNLKNKSTQGCIDAMGNAKRAIDCQIDMLINTFGYNYKEFDNRNSYPEVKTFIKNNYKEEHYNGLTEKLKLLNILGLAPTLIISNIRNIRNHMEHEYSVPSYDEVKKAIEIADLFINASNRKLCYSPTEVCISNNKYNKEGNDNLSILYSVVCPFIRFTFCTYISVNTVIIDAVYKINPSERKNEQRLGMPAEDKTSVELKIDNKYYMEVIYSLLREDCSMLPRIFNNPIEEKFINYTII